MAMISIVQMEKPTAEAFGNLPKSYSWFMEETENMKLEPVLSWLWPPWLLNMWSETPSYFTVYMKVYRNKLWRKEYKSTCSWDRPEVPGCIWAIGGGGLVAKSCLTLATPWTVARQAPLSMGFSRWENWSGLLLPSPEDLPNPGVKPRSPALQADSLPTELWQKPHVSH